MSSDHQPEPTARDAMSLDDMVTQMRSDLLRIPAERYPVQHATAQFHLGVMLTNAARVDEADAALQVAVELFDPQVLPGEHGKALNAWGAALRMAGRFDEAAAAFASAAAALKTAGLTLERGAALFNLGLVFRDLGVDHKAAGAWAQARDHLDPEVVPAQAAAVLRELGVLRLHLGDFDGAHDVLTKAVQLAMRSADEFGFAAASNVLGLVELARGRPEDAVTAFRDVTAAHPRSLRPDGYAMGKANLALAHEQAGEPERARLAARQALGSPVIPDAVRQQALDILGRVGDAPGGIFAALDEERMDRWPALVREELVRWADAGAEERLSESAAWIEGQLIRREAAPDLVEAWLNALLELPPTAMHAVMRSTLTALAEREEEHRARFRSVVMRTTARFHIPQMQRLEDSFGRISEELGQGPWT